ncbi:MAG: FtsX-like permease family protein [Phycisphaerales bacterium]|nr:MAG: FtsX-like permease family protein [Phycisphaerales bacterium]
MSMAALILKEIRHRKVNFLLGVLAVVTAVTLFISFFTAGKASNREAARLMLKMGFNLRVISSDADMDKFLLDGIPDATMPAEYLEKLASQKKISYNHLLATLQKRILWRGTDVILTGLAPEVCPPGRKTPPILSYEIERGDAYVGHRVAERLGLKEGEQVEIEGKQLKIARVLAESGGVDDIRVQCSLADAQEILGLPGRISEIKAVDCLCFAPTDNPVAILREQIGSFLPEAQVFHASTMAGTRAKTRQMIRNLFSIIMPFVIIACGIWVGVVAIMNVRDRQQEIGIMRALGYGSGRIAVLFLGKAVVTGLAGAVVGFLVGTALAMRFGPNVFEITAATMVRPEPLLLVLSLVFAPLFAAVSSFIPAMTAVAYEPAVTLREE